MTSKDLVAWGKVLAGNWLVQQAMRLDSVRVAIFFLGLSLAVKYLTDRDSGRPRLSPESPRAAHNPEGGSLCPSRTR